VLERRLRCVVQRFEHVFEVLLQLLGVLDVEELRLAEDLFLVDCRVEVKCHERLPLLAIAKDVLVDHADHFERCQEHEDHGQDRFVRWQVESLVFLEWS
jgi:hypothetical protein